MSTRARLRIAVAATSLIAVAAFPADTVSREKAISIASDYVHGLHIGEVDCMRITAHRDTTPPKEAPDAARQKLALSSFWIVTMKPLEKDCAPAHTVYVMADTGIVWYARSAR